ncbi:hypothetical protein C7N43_21525 [Sphingobacteriales bacterium UPWRP_1]|nr:hypothetical protein B6N25_09720 [Sphingobacteriales bacterium TSM_CSS]PSJ74945.1 hypothetical protein C7N43_21525 [Sphingobacteriales bacterium UPWRP_1]
MLLRFLTLVFLVTFSQLVKAQSQNDVRERHITSVDVTATDYKKSGQVKRSFTRYNRKGNVIEQVEYDKDGTTIENWTRYRYNRRGRIISEAQLSPSGDTLQIIHTRYNRFRHPVETVTTNAAGQILEKEIPMYDNFHRKTEELTLSGNGTVLKRVTYQYDTKGMLIARRTYDAQGNLQYEKIWKFEY